MEAILGDNSLCLLTTHLSSLHFAYSAPLRLCVRYLEKRLVLENDRLSDSSARIIRAIRAVPKGKVSCYRDIALAAGLPNGARQVVWVLHSLSAKHRLPWHRIIRADGTIALGAGEGGELQAQLLRAEGVAVSATGRVDMRRYAQ